MKNRWFIERLADGVAVPARVFSLAILVVILAASGFAKMYEEPKSFSLQDKSLERIDLKILPKVDVERLLADDKAREKSAEYHPAPQRFAVAVGVSYSFKNSGTWQALPDGRLWRLRIQSPGAVSHNLGITHFNMPEGAKLWIYDPEHKHVEGPYTSRHRSRRGSLWTPIIEGDEIVVEVFVPTGVSEPFIEIGKVNQGYRGFGKSIPGGGTEGTCEIDVVCSQGDPWRNQIRAVGAYTLNGSAQCTGTLLNDTALDFTPYFLSANHCAVDSSNDDTVVVYWNYQSATCGTHGPGDLTQNQTGSIFRASYAPSDFLLLELSAKPDPSFNIFHAGWDASGTTPPGTVGIHHPAGDVKAISLSNSAPQIASYVTDPPNTYHWRADWSAGVTEGGSSGSCLFATDTGRCIGVLTGGPSACGAAPANLHDFYGMFSVSWNGGGTDATQLKHWLDPGNTGTLGLDGDPHITTANGIRYDLQGAGEFISLRDPDGLEIQTRQAPIATTFNPGPDPHDGLATCVSLNTAVAARVGKHRVTYEPNLSGIPDPTSLQLRVDGILTTLGPSGRDLGDGGRLTNTPTQGGLQVDFPDNSVLFVTPSWWNDQSKWYLNVDVVRPPVVDGAAAGAFPVGGIAGAIVPGSWLPALPDGSSMGPMPGPLHERYIDLYQKFANAWRVTDRSSLFDYLPGTSTETFTMRNWPLENPPCVIPETKPVKPVSELVAQRACQPITNKNTHSNCVFDVMVTGNLGFAETYLGTQRILTGSTTTTVTDDEDPTQVGESVTFTAIVSRTARIGEGVPAGTVQFILDGTNIGDPVKLDSKGRAVWETSRLKVGAHRVAANYIPSQGSVFLSSGSRGELHTVKRCPCDSDAAHK